MARRRSQLERIRRTLGAGPTNVVGDSVFRGISSLAALHPRARPEAHGIDLLRDVPYTDTGRDAHLLDIYRPVHRPGPWPVVFYVHGGAFRLLSKDTHWVMGLSFARHGYLVVNVSYRLAPRDPFPAALADVCEALEWTRQHIADYGGDLDRIVFAGESAGGNLVTALTAACCYRRPESYAQLAWQTGLVPRVTVPAAGILQVDNIERFSQRRPLPWWVANILRATSESYLCGTDEGDDLSLASPLTFFEGAGVPDRPMPAFFIPVGTADPLLDDTRRLHRALLALGVDAEAEYYQGEVHAFHALVWRQAARRCWRDTLAFIDQRLHRSSSPSAPAGDLGEKQQAG